MTINNELKALYDNAMATNDLAVKYSIENRDYNNMQIVLRAHGLDHGLSDAVYAIRFMQELSEEA